MARTKKVSPSQKGGKGLGVTKGRSRSVNAPKQARKVKKALPEETRVEAAELKRPRDLMAVQKTTFEGDDNTIREPSRRKASPERGKITSGRSVNRAMGQKSGGPAEGAPATRPRRRKGLNWDR